MGKKESKKQMSASLIWYYANKEKCNQKRKEYYRLHKKQENKKSSEYYLIHRKELLAKKKKQYLANPEKMIKRSKKYRQKHPNQVKLYCRQYRKTEKWRIVKKMAKAKRRGFGFVSLNERFEDSHGHHLDEVFVIYIPQKLHSENSHSVIKDRNMETINSLAFDFLLKQTAEQEFAYEMQRCY